jgi:flagellar M-ring protein FliF
MAIEDDTEANVSPPAPPWRLIAAIAGASVIVLGLWYFIAFRQDYGVLYSDLRPREAAAVVAALEDEGVPFRLAEGGAEIRIPASRIDTIRLKLASSETPIGGLEGFELFNESDMGLTDFAQKIRYQRALQGELARTIMMMEGVADARVHISMPDRTLFRGERRNAEAAVTLVMQSPQDETPARIEGVQRLVAAAVPDLSIADVAVLNARGEVISPRVEINNAIVGAGQDVDPDPGAPTIEFVLSVMREALPGRQFEVSIEPVLQLEGSEDTGLTAPQRLVTVLTQAPLTDADMETVSGALRTAGIVDGETGGTLEFRRAPPRFETAESDIGRVEATQPLRPAFDPSPILSWLAGGALILVAVGFWLWRRRPALKANDHQRFADHLKAALQTSLPERQHVQ